MKVVTPLLTNRPTDVVWGTEDKTIEKLDNMSLLKIEDSEIILN